MRVRDLGPLRVSNGHERPCAGVKQEAILAMLAMNANRRVSIDELVMGARGYDASVSASTVENHIWRLRRLLDPGYSRGSSSPLITDSGGYRLVLAADALDSSIFESLAHEAGGLLTEADPALALSRCDQALALWRGASYEAILHVTLTTAATARLQELREQLLERRIDALLAIGSVQQALADLESLTVQHPFRERLWAQRMTALARGQSAAERRDLWVRQLLASRPRVGHPEEAAWYDAIDDVWPTARATLHTAVRAAPDPRVLRLGSRLLYYSYYRARVIEVRRWLQSVTAAVDSGAAGLEDSPDLMLARLCLAGAALLSGRTELALSQLDIALAPARHDASADNQLFPRRADRDRGGPRRGRRRRLGQERFRARRRIGIPLTQIAAALSDPTLALLADKVDLVAGLTTRDVAVSAARAESLYQRALTADNLLVQWGACGARVVTCVLAENPDTGVAWADRLMATHLRLGSGGTGRVS
jgi:DNA-binding SARP family transcriptional activator